MGELWLQVFFKIATIVIYVCNFKANFFLKKVKILSFMKDCLREIRERHVDLSTRLFTLHYLMFVKFWPLMLLCAHSRVSTMVESTVHIYEVFMKRQQLILLRLL